MARIRTIKPEFWTDSFMVQLPHIARLIYIAMWTAADDHGFLPDEPERLAMEVMPKEEPSIFDDWFQFFEASGRIELMASEEGKTFYRIAKWSDHQRVDKPSRSRIFREGSRKVAIPLETRRKVAAKYGCQPGDTKDVECFYCGAVGSIHWHRLSSGRPSAWVTFPGLELDHLLAEDSGGEPSPDNIVLSCRRCNRSKGTKSWISQICAVAGMPYQHFVGNDREDSCEEGKGKEGKGREGNRPTVSSSSEDDLLGTNPEKRVIEEQRLSQITDDAIATYNASTLVKRNGGLLSAVSETVGRDTRIGQVRRCVKTARDICIDRLKSKKVTRDFWEAYWVALADDDFTAGRTKGKGHENWKPDFEYFTRKATMLKVYEKNAGDEA